MKFKINSTAPNQDPRVTAVLEMQVFSLAIIHSREYVHDVIMRTGVGGWRSIHQADPSYWKELKVIDEVHRLAVRHDRQVTIISPINDNN